MTEAARIVAKCKVPSNLNDLHFFCCCNRCEKEKSVLLRATVTATKTLGSMVIAWYLTLRNDSCNLCWKGATKLRDKLQDKLPSVTDNAFIQQSYIFNDN